LLALGALGAGAAPVFNPVATTPVLDLFSRMPTVSLACAFVGMGMVVFGWLWLGRLARPGKPRLASTGALRRVMLMWAAPLALAPPLFSRDVYLYLAQSKIAALGMNPYVLGPSAALGNADVFTQNVSDLWRHTSSAYGPLFISVGRGLAVLAGNNVVAGVLLQRLVALVGVALVVWALPRLAERFGVQPVGALWLGALNPLVLFHLVAGAHNGALMIGLMLAGLEVAMMGMPAHARADHPPPMRLAELGWLVAGATMIALGAAVKIPALPALGFLGALAARRLGGSWRSLVAVAALFVAIAAVVLCVFSLATGLGFGWVAALDTNGTIRSTLSPTTDIAYAASGIGVFVGLGSHVDAAVATTRVLGLLASVAACAKLVWDTFVGRFNPMLGLGLAMAAVVLLGATVQPWYLLWAAIPLAAGIGHSRFRTAAALASAAVALMIPPTGSAFDGRTFVLWQAYLAAGVVIALMLIPLSSRIPVFPLRLRRLGRAAYRSGWVTRLGLRAPQKS
jgi:alpha-1,6-mannosyltransferase